MNSRGHDADFAVTRGNDAWAIGPNKARAAVLQEFPGSNHIEGWNSLGDADDQFQFSVGRFHDRVSGEWRGNEDDGRIGRGLLHSLMNGIEDGPTFVSGAALAGSDPAHDLRPIFRASLGVKRALAPRQPLNDHSRRF